MNLIQFEVIKISSLIVIAQDSAASPVRVTTAIFILQSVPQRNVSQSPGRHDLCRKANGAVTLAGAAPYDQAGAFVHAEKKIWRGCK